MSENQIIAATIQVDTGNSNANVGELNKNTSTLKGNLKDVGATVKGTGKEVGLAGGNFEKLKGQISAMPGPTKNLTEGLGGVNTAFNLLKANPIIGIFALLAGIVLALFDKFRKMEAVSDSLGKAFAVLSSIFSTFANKILTPLIEGFTKFIDLAIKAATFVADIFSPGLKEAAERSGELADALDDLNDAEADSAIARAESNRKLQEARDLASDANIPIKERIKALKEAAIIEKEEFDKSITIATNRAKIMLEQIGIELGVRKELIDSIRNGSVEQLKAARNEIMAMQNVDKEKLQAIDALIIQAEDQGAERAKISKKTEGQITSLEKEEESKRKEARQKAAADQKAEQQKLNEFNNKLRQLQQDNELNLIKDGYQKELRQLEIKLQNEKNLNAQAVKEGRLTREQAIQLDNELQKQADLKRLELTDKHNKEVAEKEEAFQKDLRAINLKTRIAGTKDATEAGLEQLKSIQKQRLDSIVAGLKEEADLRLRTLEAENEAEKKANIEAFNKKKISQEQLQKLNAELDSKLFNQRAGAQKKFNADSIKEEKRLQDELNDIINTVKGKPLSDDQIKTITEQQKEKLKVTLDGLEKERAAKEKALLNEIETAKAANNKLYQAKKISLEELEKLNNGLEIKLNTERNNLQKDFNDRSLQAENKYREDLAAIIEKSRGGKISDGEIELLKAQQKEKLAVTIDGINKEFEVKNAGLQQDAQLQKKANEEAFKNKKISADQLQALNKDVDEKLASGKDALQKQVNNDILQKETEFQSRLNEIISISRLGGLSDVQKAELVELRKGYEEKLNDAIKTYKEDAVKLSHVKLALQQELSAEEEKALLKFKAESDKKKFDEEEKKLKGKVDDPKSDFKARIDALNAEQELVQKAFDDKIIAEEDYTTKTAALAEVRKKIKEEEQQHTQTIVDATETTLGNLSNLAGKQTVAGKAFAIAQTAIDTYQSAISSYKSLSGIPVVGPALGAVAAAAAIKNGLESVKKITSIQVPGGGGGGANASAPNVSPAAPIAPTPGSTKLDPDTIDSLNNPANGGVNKQPTFKTYVLSGEVQSEAERNARLERAATLGGG